MANLADLFVDFWTTIEAKYEDAASIADRHEKRPKRVLRWARELDSLLAKQRSDPVENIRAWIASKDKALPKMELARVILSAQAIERWYAPLVDDPDLDDARTDALLLLRTTGGLNTSEGEFCVLPKRPRWGRWHLAEMGLPAGDKKEPGEPAPVPADLERERIAEFMSSIFRWLLVAPRSIEAEDPDAPNRKRLVKLSYKMLDLIDLRHVDRNWVPVVGFAPLALSTSDIDLQLRQETGVHWYDAQAVDLGDRAAKAVATLCEAGAHIIILPEMSVHPAAQEAICSAIRTHGPTNQLLLVVAGTSRRENGSSRPFNEALLYNHRGDEVGRQRKLHRWNLSTATCTRYGLEDLAKGDGSALYEFITPGEEVAIIEQPQFGRLAVMICEDLGRSEPGRWLRKNVLLDWLFTPILDSSIDTGRWMATSGRRAAMGGHCRIVVANSLVLTHRQNSENQKGGRNLLDTAGIGLCIDLQGNRPKYRLEQLALNPADPATCLTKWEPTRWVGM